MIVTTTVRSRITRALACLAFASVLVNCGTSASSTVPDDGFTTTVKTGSPRGPAHAFVMAESPDKAFAFRTSVPGSAKRPVIAHYFPPYPLTLGGRGPQNDYYERNYLRPEGENGKFAAYGGLMRQRPLPGPASEQQRKSDLRIELARAARIGIDVFGVDLLNFNGRVAAAVPGLLEAAQETDPRFRIAIEPDMYALKNVTVDQLFDYLLIFAKHPAAFRSADGRLVVMPFKAEARPPEFWRELIDRMEKAGEPIAFIPIFVQPANGGQYAGFSAAASRWITTSSNSGMAQGNFGKAMLRQGYPAWIVAAAPQDSRPKDGFTFEAHGSQSFTDAIKTGIEGGASGLHLVTWNDYTEATELQPSSATRFAYYDIAAYYIAWFKTGSPPKIERDGFVGIHRKQLFRPGDRSRGKPWRIRGGPGVDIVEMTAFLTAPAEVRITSGGKTFSERADAGMHRFTAPASVGAVSMAIVRNGRSIASCKSPWTIEAQPDRHNPVYAGFSSLRGCN